MSKLLKGFEKVINKNQLFTFEDHLLVAVSGGLDSIVLLHLLHERNYTFSIAHCNFQLRGNSSYEDERLVRSLAERYKCAIYIERFDTAQIAKTQRESTQLTARKLRYDWFDKLLNENGFTKLLTAHHANDQLETVLYNLTKGTGISGLRGIPLGSSKLARPLLHSSKAMLHSYALEQKLRWREDDSNLDDKYSRNKIRLKVIPALKEINPGIEKTIESNTARYASIEKLLLTEVEKIKKKHITQTTSSISISTDWYNEDFGGLTVLTELLKAYEFIFDQCQSIGEIISANSHSATGKQFHSPTHTLLFNREEILLTPRNENNVFDLQIEFGTQEICTPTTKFTLAYHDTKVDWTTDKYVAYLDADKLQFPLNVRNWLQGDHFIPLGMKGKKKVSDFMIDEKIPVNLKSSLPIILSNEKIVWVAGHRIDDRFRIDANTKQVLIIRMTKNV